MTPVKGSVQSEPKKQRVFASVPENLSRLSFAKLMQEDATTPAIQAAYMAEFDGIRSGKQSSDEEFAKRAGIHVRTASTNRRILHMALAAAEILETKPDVSWLKASQQARLDRIKAIEIEKLERAFQVRAEAAAKKHAEDLELPKWFEKLQAYSIRVFHLENEIKRRGPFIPHEIFRTILGAVHAQCSGPLENTARAAFDWLNENRDKLQAKPLPAHMKDIPKTPEELRAYAEASRSKNSA